MMPSDMANLARHCASCMVATVFAICMQSTISHARIVDMNSDPGLALGKGYDTDSARAVGECVTSGDSPTVPTTDSKTNDAIEYSSDFEIIETMQDMRRHLDLSAEVSVKSMFANANVKTSYEKRVSKNSYNVFAIVSIVARAGVKQLKKPKLRDGYFDMLKNNPTRFREACGNTFVSEIIRGARFYGLVEVHTTSQEDARSVAASLSGTVSIITANGNVKTELAEKLSKKRVSVTVYASGGAVNNFSRSLELMFDSADHFVKHIASKPKEIIANTSNYSTLILPEDAEPPIVSHFRMDSISDLIKLADNAKLLLADIEYIRQNRNQFDDFDADELEQVSTNLVAYRGTVNATIMSCYGPEQKCNLPDNLAFPSVKLPNRRQSNTLTNFSVFEKRIGRQPVTDTKDSNGWTDLHYIALLDLPSEADTLISKMKDARQAVNQPIEPQGLMDRELWQLVKDLGWSGSRLRVGQTPMHIAAQENSVSTLERMIAYTGDPNVSDRKGRVPLHYAAMMGAKDAAHILAQHGKIDLYRKDRAGRTPLYYALTSEHIELAEMLIGYYRDENLALELDKTFWLSMVRNNNLNSARLVLRKTRGEVLPYVDERGDTALHISVREKNYDMASLLLEPIMAEEDKKAEKKHVDIDAQNSRGETALHWAALRGGRLFVELLIEKQASIEKEDYRGMTALHWAALRAGVGSQFVIDPLIRAGGDLLKRDKKGRTPLHLAAMRGYGKVVEALLPYGRTQEYIADNRGRFAIHVAASNGHVNVVRKFMEHDSQYLRWKDDQHKATPLHHASKECHHGMVRFLLGSGAEVNARDARGQRPLHWAASTEAHPRYPCIIVAEMLIKSGANVNAIDKFQRAPLYYTRRNPAIAETLKANGARFETNDPSDPRYYDKDAVFVR